MMIVNNSYILATFCQPPHPHHPSYIAHCTQTLLGTYISHLSVHSGSVLSFSNPNSTESIFVQLYRATWYMFVLARLPWRLRLRCFCLDVFVCFKVSRSVLRFRLMPLWSRGLGVRSWCRREGVVRRLAFFFFSCTFQKNHQWFWC